MKSLIWIIVCLCVGAFAEDHDGTQPDQPGASVQNQNPKPKPADGEDPVKVFRESLRRLPDPAVLGLSRKIAETIRSKPSLDAKGFGSIVDGIPGLSNEQKAQLKNGFDPFSKKLGNEAANQLVASITDVVKERNLSVPPVQEGIKNEEISTPESDALKAVQDQLKGLQAGFDAKLKDLDKKREKDRESRDGERQSDRERGGSQGGQDQGGQDQGGSQSSEGERRKKDEARHTEKNKERNNPSKNFNFGNSNNQDESKKSDSKDSSFELGKGTSYSKKPKALESPTPEVTKDEGNPPGGEQGPGFAGDFNMGLMGSKSTPESIARGSSSFGNDFNGGGFGSGASGAVSGAVAASKAGAGGDDGGFMTMTYSDEGGGEGGGSGGSISGAYQGGVSYISGSSPDSDDEIDNPEYTKSLPNQIQTSGRSFIYPDWENNNQNIFERMKKALKAKACTRVSC